MLTHDDPAVHTAKVEGLEESRDYVNQYGLSRQAIFNQVVASLERLDTPYIDLLQIHRADLTNVTAEETMKALHDLVQSGKVRYIGASSMWAWQLAHYNHVAEQVCCRLFLNFPWVTFSSICIQNGWTQFVSMQNRYSVVYREEERETNAYCAFAGIGLIPWGPLNAGLLARPLDAQFTTERSTASPFPPKPEWKQEIFHRVEKISKEKGWTMSQVALAYVNDKVTSPIVGISSVSVL
jgi:aryl-alcohol dehydrogenase-like predicted oxidoreductase